MIKGEKKILMAFAVLYLLFAFFKADMRIRYIAPIIPPLIILAMYGLHQISTFVAGYFSGLFRRLIASSILVAVVFMLSVNGAYIWRQFNYVDPMSYLSSRVTREAYIERYRPEYSAIQYANLNLRSNSKILCLYLGNRRYYSDKEMFFNDTFFRSAVMEAEPLENILVDLKRQGITHLLIRYDLFNQWSNRQLNGRNKKALDNFFKNHTHRLFSEAGYGLYQLQFQSWLSSEVMRKD